jgi:hypothetical protein
MTTKHRSRKYLWLMMLVSASLLLTIAASPILMAQKISGLQVLYGDVYDYEVNTTSRYTVFRSDARVNQIFELFSVLTWGSERILLSPGMTEARGVLDFILSPDGTTAVYWVGFGENEDRAEAIYAVPVAGGTAINLTGDIVPGLYLEGIEISADSEWLFYTLGDLANEHVLYRVPLDGSSEPSAKSPTAEGCLDLQFRAMPMDHGGVYARTKLGLAGSELVYVDPGGVSHILRTIAGVFGEGTFSPDGNWIVFIEQLYSVAGDDLYALSLDGLTLKHLNDTLTPGGNVVNFKISDDSSVVIYKADQDTNDQFELYTVVLDTLLRFDLTPVMVVDGDVLDYELVNFENKVVGVVYRADQLVDERIDLGSVEIDGTPAYLLSPGLPPNGDVTDFKVWTNGLAVVFSADYVDEVFNLWINTTIGSELAPVGIYEEIGPIDWPAFSDVVDFTIAPSSGYVVFMANLDEQYTTELYLAGLPTAGWTLRQKLNAPLVEDGNIGSYLITPNSQGVVYRANQDDWETWELYSVFNRYVQYMPIVFR